MYHFLYRGKYYLFSLLLHLIFITLASVFISAPAGDGGAFLPAHDGQEKTLRVSFNRNHTVAAQNNPSQTKAEIKNTTIEKNSIVSNETISNEAQFISIDENSRESREQAKYGAGFFRRARLVSELRPVYPTYAVRRGIEGTVLVDVSIDSLGRVSGTEIVTSSNYAILDRAAIRCVRRVRFIPASYMGKPVADTLRIAINFRLQTDYD